MIEQEDNRDPVENHDIPPPITSEQAANDLYAQLFMHRYSNHIFVQLEPAYGDAVWISDRRLFYLFHEQVLTHVYERMNRFMNSVSPIPVQEQIRMHPYAFSYLENTKGETPSVEVKAAQVDMHRHINSTKTQSLSVYSHVHTFNPPIGFLKSEKDVPREGQLKYQGVSLLRCTEPSDRKDRAEYLTVTTITNNLDLACVGYNTTLENLVFLGNNETYGPIHIYAHGIYVGSVTPLLERYVSLFTNKLSP